MCECRFLWWTTTRTNLNVSTTRIRAFELRSSMDSSTKRWIREFLDFIEIGLWLTGWSCCTEHSNHGNGFCIVLIIINILLEFVRLCPWMELQVLILSLLSEVLFILWIFFFYKAISFLFDGNMIVSLVKSFKLVLRSPLLLLRWICPIILSSVRCILVNLADCVQGVVNRF